MSLEVLFDSIRQQFSPSEAKAIVRSLQKDPLVWQFTLDDENKPSYLESASIDLDAYSPGEIAVWLIQKEVDTELENLQDLETSLPDELLQRANLALDSTLNSGLPPADLLTASLLAFALREKRRENGSWRDIPDQILIKRTNQDLQKNYLIWRTPFAILYHLCSDYDDLVSELLDSKTDPVISAAIPVIIHTLLANPMEPQALLDKLFSFSQTLQVDHQLETLKWLDEFKRPSLRESLAKHLIQTKGNVDLFAMTFAELEAAGSYANGKDPLNEWIRYTLPEDLNRLAAFNAYSGDTRKASELYQKSSDLLGVIKSQALYQSLASTPNQATPSNWLGILKSNPESVQARLFYIRALIQERKLDEARNNLADLPDSPEKTFLQSRLVQTKDVPVELPGNLNLQSISANGRTRKIIGYYPNQADAVIDREIFKTLVESGNINSDASYIDKYLEKNNYDPEIVLLLRDAYVNSHQYNHAIEWTSYLNLVEPDQEAHKHKLAILYCMSERWQDAYNHIQKVVKSDPAPAVEDLESFAQAALKTDRVDMAISICQNILKQTPQNTKALVFLGESYMAKGDPVKAIQHMEQVVEMIPGEAETWLILAHLWEEYGQSDRAFEILNKGMRALPQSSQLMYALGKAHLEQQSPADALTYLKKAFNLEPENNEIKLSYAQAQYQLGKYEQAWQLLEPYMTRYRQDPSIAKLLGNVLLAMDRKETAEPILLFAAENTPEDLETVLKAADISLESIETSYERPEKDKLNQLVFILENALEKNPYNTDIQLHLADLKRLNDKHQEAMDMYIALSEMAQPQAKSPDWRFSYGLGQAAIALGNDEIGLASLQEACNQHSGNLMILHALAEAYQKTNLQDKSHKTAKSAMKLAPQDAKNILWYADFKTRYNEPDEAVKALRDALQIMPHRADLKLWLLKSLIAKNAAKESREMLEELIADSETSPSQLHQTAYLCIQINAPDLSVQALEKASQLNPEMDPILLMDLARCYTLCGQHQDALDTLNLAGEIFEEHPELALLKADLLIELGQYDSAYQTLKIIETTAESTLKNALDEDNPVINSPLLYTCDFSIKGYFYRLGQLQRTAGEIKEAQSTLTKALAMDPADIQFRNACASVYAVGIDFENALNICREADKQDSKQAFNSQIRLDLLCTQAEVLLNQNEIDAANTLLDGQKFNDPTYPRLTAILSRLAFALGEVETAQAHLERACQSYESEWQDANSTSLASLFRKTAILHSLAKASEEQEDLPKAVRFQGQANALFDDQPLYNWHYASILTKAAQVQQIANLLSITVHAPGSGILLENIQTLCQDQLGKCKRYLPEDQWVCQNAQCIAAFTGVWPLNLNVDACLVNSEMAAAVIISCSDEALVKDILDSYPDDIRVLQAYGLHALRFGKDDGAAYVEKALQKDVSNPVNHMLLTLLNWNKPELAINSLKSALSFWPDESKWHALAGDLYTQIGDTDSASYHIQKALDAQPENASFWQQSADIKILNNDLEQARADLEESAAIQSLDPQIWVKMATVNQRMGNLSEAIENLHTASSLAPQDMDIALQEINILLDQGQFSDAESKAKEILIADAKNEETLIYLARSQAKQGKFDAALEGLTSAVISNPRNQKLKLESIKIKKDREGPESALPDLIALAQQNPDDPDILTALTDLLIQTNRLEEAEETAQTILRIIPEQAEVHLMLGRLQRKNGKLDQAIVHLSEAIQYEPGMVEAYLELGKTHQERRNLEEAIKVFQKGSKANSTDPRPYYYAAMALKDCKDYPAAETMLKQAKRYAPEDTDIIRQLGVVTALNLINNLREAR